MRASPILFKALRRLPLTTKQAGKNYYKGTGTGAMGRHTMQGGYRLDVAKMRTYVVPDLTNFELTPFVDRNLDPRGPDLLGLSPMNGLALIKKWKADGGVK